MNSVCGEVDEESDVVVREVVVEVEQEPVEHVLEHRPQEAPDRPQRDRRGHSGHRRRRDRERLTGGDGREQRAGGHMRGLRGELEEREGEEDGGDGDPDERDNVPRGDGEHLRKGGNR